MYHRYALYRFNPTNIQSQPCSSQPYWSCPLILIFYQPHLEGFVVFYMSTDISCLNKNYLYICIQKVCIWHRAETIRSAHDMIQYTIWCIRYDTFHDTFAILIPGKQRLVIPACDQKHCTSPTATACAVMMRSGYNNGGLLKVSRCSVFVMNLLVLLEYTGCYLWYLIFLANFDMFYNCSVSYRIFLRAYCDM